MGQRFRRFMYTQRLYQKVTLRPLPRWIHRYKVTASVCRMYVIIVLPLPPHSVIGSLSQVKIWFMVPRLPGETKASLNYIGLKA